MADASGNPRQVLLLAVLLVGALGWAGNRFVYAPRSAELQLLQERVERLEAQNETARRLTAAEGRSEVERRLAVYREQLLQVEGLIPSSEELPDLLDATSAEAQRTGVDLSLIQPVGATAEQFYTRRSYELAVLGSYHAIGSFLGEIASLPRIVTPTTLDLTVEGDAEPGRAPRLQAKFAIETYVLPSAAETGTPNE
jgi:type IV pilus assembly protein PilO